MVNVEARELYFALFLGTDPAHTRGATRPLKKQKLFRAPPRPPPSRAPPLPSPLRRPPNPPTAPAPLPPLRLFALRTAAPSSDPSAAPALRTLPRPPPSSPLRPALVPLPLRLLRPSKLTRATASPCARGLRGPGRGPPRRRRRWRCSCGERGGGEADFLGGGRLKGGGRAKGGKVRRVRGGYMADSEAREYIFPISWWFSAPKKIFPAPPGLAWPSTSA